MTAVATSYSLRVAGPRKCLYQLGGSHVGVRTVPTTDDPAMNRLRFLPNDTEW
jgi:hypothetical protein